MARKKVEATVSDKPGQSAMDAQSESRPEPVKTEEMKLSLFDYRQEMARIESMVSETGEITEDQAAALVAAHKGSIEKMKCLAWVITKADQAIEAIDAEIKRLAELKSYRDSVINRIKAALVRHILEVEPERKKIDLDTYILKAHKCPASVQLIPEFDDPFYMRITGIKGKSGGELSAATIDMARANGDDIIAAPDKKAIKAALESGTTIDGADLIDDKHILKIQ